MKKSKKKYLTNPRKTDTIRISISYRSVPGKHGPEFVRSADLQSPPHKWHGFRILTHKQALLHEVGLPAGPDSPLITFLNRLVYQKGVDLALEGLRQVADLPWRAIFLGTGEPGLEAAARQFEAEFPSRVRAVIRFDAQLARRIYAGGDFILLPSRYEPCGLVQMIAMRYGCIPVARATGGLKDTILDCADPAQSTGFLFGQATPDAMAGAIRRALEAYSHSDQWQARQRLAMQQDFSWRRSARSYLQIYHRYHDQQGIG